MSTITKEFTKEQLQQIIETDHVQCGEASSLARIALASLEAEAVGEVVLGEYDDCGCHPDAKVVCIAADGQADWENFKDGTRLYTAPPAPVSVPECFKRLLHHAYGMTMGHDWNKGTMAGHHRAKLCQAVDECRAAMLQGADGTLTNEGTIPVTQFKPVADLYGLTSPTGGETSFTFDAVEARDFIDGGWLCQEYVELERFQEAITNHTEDKLAMVDHSGDSNNMVESVTTANKLPDDFDFDRFNDVVWLEAVASNPHMHSLTTSTIAMVALELNRKLADCNSPVIPDGWVACSERMPDEGSKVIVFRPRAEESNDPPVKTATYKGGREYYHGFDCYCEPTHWMPLPAAPQQGA
ncbi:DUF551 domain-containing protein [Enterobacter rongchengensis]|uniref:DUF551 domain-containing protein n=1 Tax=Enterobacter rongchengensis TaxID=3030999 RepID=UPI003B2442ED